MRNMKDSILEEPLIHLRIWIGNDDVMNKEGDEDKAKEGDSTHETNKDKYLNCLFLHI